MTTQRIKAGRVNLLVASYWLPVADHLDLVPVISYLGARSRKQDWRRCKRCCLSAGIPPGKPLMERPFVIGNLRHLADVAWSSTLDQSLGRFLD